jgi:UDPglucose 6-dehydrogenase
VNTFMDNINRVSVIGLGKLGASMAASIASRGFDVVGVDISKRSVDLLNAGHAPVQETDLERYIGENRARLRATTDHADAIHNSDCSFVIVPTPSDERGSFTLRYAIHAFREIGRALKTKPGYHLLVMTSTVLPGSTRHGLIPVIEAESGKRCGVDFGLCYSPEFIALGSVIRDFLNPDFNLIGEFDARSGALLEDLYARIMLNKVPARRMSLENAELAKISLNAYVTTKITFANMLADICQRLPGGDVDVVTNAIGLDTRIGRKYLTGALGYGGPCFPRDNVALAYFARAIGAQATLSEATDQSNRALAERIASEVVQRVPKDASIAILGLSYKPASVVIEESQGVYLAKALSKKGLRVLGFDPLANAAARTELQYHALVVDSLEDCLAQADVVIVANPDPVFKDIRREHLKPGVRVDIIDFWRLLSDRFAGDPTVNYAGYGRGGDDAAKVAQLRALWSET